MKNFLTKIPDPVLRLVIVFSLLIGGVVLVRKYLISPELKESGFQRTSAIERELSREIRYAGAAACGECHEDQYTTRMRGYHKGLSCELCHGAAREHVEEPFDVSPLVPRERKFCPLCHTYNLSRPTGYPQINPVAHNPLQPCVTCHDPHDPEPPQAPRECVACHAQIARTKAVSPHVLLECTTCHATPEVHKINPRLVKSSRPIRREFCGQCHGVDSDLAAAPKVDFLTHGEKYLCWQCHYPHMPELR